MCKANHYKKYHLWALVFASLEYQTLGSSKKDMSNTYMENTIEEILKYVVRSIKSVNNFKSCL